jgi:hypothetical protein
MEKWKLLHYIDKISVLFICSYFSYTHAAFSCIKLVVMVWRVVLYSYMFSFFRWRWPEQCIPSIFCRTFWRSVHLHKWLFSCWIYVPVWLETSTSHSVGGVTFHWFWKSVAPMSYGDTEYSPWIQMSQITFSFMYMIGHLEECELTWFY